MKNLLFSICLSSLIPGVVACSSDGGDTPADTSAPADTTPQEDVSGDASGDVADDTGADVPTVCQNECLNSFGNNDKSLCPDPKSDWNCVAGCCEPVFKCGSDADCEVQGYEEGHCANHDFGCLCDVPTGQCFNWACAANGDCASDEVCAAGLCVDAPDLADTDLRIINRPTVIAEGHSITLFVERPHKTIADITLAADVANLKWESSNGSAVSVVDGVVMGGHGAGTATITVTDEANGATTSWDVRNTATMPTDTLTVICASEGSAKPVAGRYAIINPKTKGTVAVGEIPSDGIIRAQVGEDVIVDVHIFADGHDWVSTLGVVGAYHKPLYLSIPRTLYSTVELTPTGDVLASGTVLTNSQLLGGEPDYSQYERTGNIDISLTSFGLSSALFDFSLPTLLGADVTRYLDPDHNIPQVDATEAITVPGGVVFNLAGPAVPDFLLAAPTGPNKIWTLGGRVDIGELAEFSTIVFDAVAGGDLDVGLIVGALLPLFRHFDSSYQPLVDIAEGTGFDVTPLSPKLRMSQGLMTTMTLPKLPTLGEHGFAGTVFLMTGGLTADGFMIPLGLNGGADTIDETVDPADGFVDGDLGRPGLDPFSLFHAPMHSGLQGPHSQFLTAAVAVSINKGGGDTTPEGGSVIMLRSGLDSGLGESLSPEAFLAFPMASTWDPASRAVAVEAIPSADAQRLLFKGKKGENWTIWTGGADAFVVPNPAVLLAGLQDGNLTVDRATNDVMNVLVNSLEFAGDTSEASLLGVGDQTVDIMLNFTDRVNFLDIKDARPAVQD